MLSITGNNGNLLSCKYDSNGNLSSVSDMHGHDITITKISTYNYKISAINSKNFLSLEFSNNATFTFDNIRKLTVSKSYNSYRKYDFSITDSFIVNNQLIKNNIYRINNHNTTVVQKNDDDPVCYYFAGRNILSTNPIASTPPR